MLDMVKWNVAVNQEWWVRLADAGTGIEAGLYLSLDDAQAEANRQSYGASIGYGTALPVVLVSDNEDAPGQLQSEYGWHLAVSGQAADPARMLRVGPFVELPEISHSIYRDSRLIERKATAEIDAHTHANIARTVSLGAHLPELAPGDTAQISSTRRGIDALGQVMGQRIAGERNSLTSELDIFFYMELTR